MSGRVIRLNRNDHFDGHRGVAKASICGLVKSAKNPLVLRACRRFLALFWARMEFFLVGWLSDPSGNVEPDLGLAQWPTTSQEYSYAALLSVKIACKAENTSSNRRNHFMECSLSWRHHGTRHTTGFHMPRFLRIFSVNLRASLPLASGSPVMRAAKKTFRSP